jgi:beta-carotene 3-hydroxylase
LFPVVFSLPAIAALSAAATGVAPAWTWWAGAGITAYGVAYLAVHELVIHHRFCAPVPDGRYVRWLRAAHAAHHVDGGEPFGMLLPLVSSGRRQRLARSGSPSADDVLLRRVSTRPMRSRL